MKIAFYFQASAPAFCPRLRACATSTLLFLSVATIVPHSHIVKIYLMTLVCKHLVNGEFVGLIVLLAFNFNYVRKSYVIFDNII